jgi:hypothetical protein
MALNTTYETEIVIADDPENIIFGTCMLGETYGSVESASVKRTGDREEIKKCGNKLLAIILSNLRFELTLKTLFTDDATEPDLGGSIVFPLAGIEGRILDITVDWEQAGQRMLSIEATSFDSLTDGKGVARVADDGTGLPITIT